LGRNGGGDEELGWPWRREGPVVAELGAEEGLIELSAHQSADEFVRGAKLVPVEVGVGVVRLNLGSACLALRCW
jgi:hypothetical protein